MTLQQTKNRDHEVVYLPKNLNIREKIHADLPYVKRHYGNMEKVSERIAVILGQLFHRMIFNKDLDKSYSYISLNAQILESLVEDYRPILDWAIESKIIETDGHYIAGEKSTGYRFHSDYWRKSRKHYIYDPTLIKNLRSRRVDPTTVKNFGYLYQCLEEIDIDIDLANEIMEQIYLKELEEGKTPQIELELKLMSRKAAIESLHEKRLYFKKDKTVHRLHTNITGLKREARKCLTWKGKQLVNVDISNSQPYFSICLLNKGAYSNLSISTLLSYYNPHLTDITTIMFRRFADISGTYMDYIAHVTHGTLYGFLGKELGISRKEAKELIFNIFFSVPSWDFPGKKEFIKLFPEVWDVFKRVNTGFSKTKKQGRKKGDQSNTLAMLLQRVESIVMLEHIVPRIMKEAPDLPIWTIHDSILTVKGQEELITDIIQEEAAKLLGWSPTVTSES